MSHSKIPPVPSTAWLAREETAAFLRIVASGVAIKRRSDVSVWLGGEMQDLLPHEVLIAAHGDPARFQTKLDVVLRPPDVPIDQPTEAELVPLIDEAYTQWVEGNRQPQSVIGKGAPGGNGSSPFKRAVEHTHSVFVHGVHDAREARDSIYIIYSRRLVNGHSNREPLFWLALLTPQIDTALRSSCADNALVMSPGQCYGEDDLNLSSREQQVLELIWRGKSNADIGTALGISPFTVKNHLQRIFGKIGVNNRTQAATKYGDVVQRLRSSLA